MSQFTCAIFCFHTGKLISVRLILHVYDYLSPTAENRKWRNTSYVSIHKFIVSILTSSVQLYLWDWMDF